jgi:hypothetical protein
MKSLQETKLPTTLCKKSYMESYGHSNAKTHVSFASLPQEQEWRVDISLFPDLVAFRLSPLPTSPSPSPSSTPKEEGLTTYPLWTLSGRPQTLKWPRQTRKRESNTKKGTTRNNENLDTGELLLTSRENAFDCAWKLLFSKLRGVCTKYYHRFKERFDTCRHLRRRVAYVLTF